MTATAIVTARTFISVAEAAFVLDCSANTVRRLIIDGRLPAIDVGSASKRRWRIRQDDLGLIRSERVLVAAA